MTSVKEIFQQATSKHAFVSSYFEHLFNLIKQVDQESIVSFLDCILDAKEKDRFIYFMGNGGSAATASHFANDLGIGTRAWSKPIRAMSLCDNNAVMTAIGNDFGYDELFKRQLQINLKASDVVVVLSASGNSENLIRAVEYAKQVGAKTVALLGFDGGKLKDLVDLSVVIPTETGDYGPSEDFHMILDHLVGNYLMNKYREES